MSRTHWSAAAVALVFALWTGGCVDDPNAPIAGALLPAGITLDVVAPVEPTGLPQVDAGGFHTCAVKPDGGMVCWGRNVEGQSSPPSGSYTQVSAGDTHTCAVQTNGEITCWGFNGSGRATPTAGRFAQVSAGLNHTCAVQRNGHIACWGDNGLGQSSPPAGTFRQVSAGREHTCAVRTDGVIACWGRNDFQQSSPFPGSYSQVSAGSLRTCALRTDGNLSCFGGLAESRPPSLPPGVTFTRVSVGDNHTCAGLTDGRVACWGDNTWGQTSGPAGSFTEVSAGGLHTCAVRTDGGIACWGRNAERQSLPPVLSRAPQVDAGGSHTCAVQPDGGIACWGDDALDQSSPSGGSFTQVSAGNDHTCAVQQDGSVACWGFNNIGQSSPPTGTFTQVSAGVEHTCAVKTDGGIACWGSGAPPPAGTFTQVSAAANHTCAVQTDGGIACWGSNGHGQASPPDGTFRQLSAGFDYTCAVEAEGSIACWGDNSFGKASPPAGTTFTHVSAGAVHTCAAQTDGGIACWGDNSFGQSSPPSLPPEVKFTQVSAGSRHSCAVKTDGEIACWGDNGVGQSNQLPAATFSVPAAADEGSALSLSLTNPMDEDVASVSYAFDCGDGSGYGAFGPAATISCATTDNGTRTVRGKVQDSQGAESEYTATVVVENVAPTAVLVAPAHATVGAGYTLSLTDAADASPADAAAGFRYTFDCGNGSKIPFPGSQSTRTCASPSEPGSYRVWGQVWDKDDGFSQYEATVEVQRAPTATFSAPATVPEGSSFTLALMDPVDEDVGTLSYAFDCGEGSGYGAFGPAASTSCSTRDNATLAVGGRARDHKGGEAEYTATVVAINVAPTAVLLAPAQVLPGAGFTLSLADATDASPADAAAGFRYTFDCGNGSKIPFPGSQSTRTCASPTEPGSYRVWGQVWDKDDGFSQYEATVEVRSNPPTATFSAPSRVAEGSSFALALMNQVDEDVASLSYSFDCGDGSGYGAFGPANVAACPTSDNGVRAVRGKVRDRDGGETEYTASVTVNNVVPVVSDIAGATILKGETFRSGGSFTDPGADIWTATVDYGDGSGAQPLALAGTSFRLTHVYRTAGSYSPRVTVTDDDGGTGHGQAAVEVLSPQQASQALTDLVHALVLSAGEANSLEAKLNAAILRLNLGNESAAMNQLEAFINEVSALVRSRRLSAADGTSLTDYANRIIASINR